MYSRISKKIVCQLFVENKRCLSRELILKVFKYICDKEGVDLELDMDLQKKIKSTIVCIEVRYNKVLRLKSAKAKLMLKLEQEFIEFEVHFKKTFVEMECTIPKVVENIPEVVENIPEVIPEVNDILMEECIEDLLPLLSLKSD
jgi:hypothetical protein